MGANRLTHYVYKLTVGGVPYFGYTSRLPHERLKEHIEEAKKGKWRHNSLLYPKLVEEKYRYEFEVIAEHDHEVPALLQEIMEIRDHEETLNLSKGGEGSTVRIRIREYKNGNVQYKVVPRKASKRNRRPKRPRRRR